MDAEERKVLYNVNKNIEEMNKNIKELLNVFIRMEKDYSSDPTYLKTIEKDGVGRMGWPFLTLLKATTNLMVAFFEVYKKW